LILIANRNFRWMALGDRFPSESVDAWVFDSASEDSANPGRTRAGRHARGRRSPATCPLVFARPTWKIRQRGALLFIAEMTMKIGLIYRNILAGDLVFSQFHHISVL
jgi:hypothetical protein